MRSKNNLLTVFVKKIFQNTILILQTEVIGGKKTIFKWKLFKFSLKHDKFFFARTDRLTTTNII